MLLQSHGALAQLQSSRGVASPSPCFVASMVVLRSLAAGVKLSSV